MDDSLFLILLVLGGINLVAFLAMLIDKMRARKGRKERISEGLLFFMATAMGSIGVFVGMFLLSHKTRKWYFKLGIPLLGIQNGAFVYLIYLLFNNQE